MKRFLSMLIVFVSFISSPAAGDEEMGRDELERVLKYLQAETVSVEISARITGSEGEHVWNTQSRQLTVSGRSVNISLDGENIRVVAHIIPFLNEDDSILLVAKGEVWIHRDPDKETEYFSTMKSIPVRAGESIMFFPVGVAVDVDKNVYSIEMEIRVSPYTSE